MSVVEIFVPAFDNQGKRFPKKMHLQVKTELLNKFSGLTAYNRAPAEGLWRKGKALSNDTMIVYEIMVQRFDFHWWHRYRKALQKRFRQESLLMRRFPVRVI